MLSGGASTWQQVVASGSDGPVFGQTSFLQSFWNGVYADNDFFHNNSCSYYAIAIATGSITDSTAQDDIPEKPIVQLTIRFPSTHLGKTKQCPMPSNLSNWLSQW